MKMKWEKARAEAEKPQTNFNGCSVVLSAKPLGQWLSAKQVAGRDDGIWGLCTWTNSHLRYLVLNKFETHQSFWTCSTGSTSGPACLCAPSWLDRSVPRAFNLPVFMTLRFTLRLYRPKPKSQTDFDRILVTFRQDCRFADGMNHLLTCRWQFKNWSFSRRCVFSFPFWRCDLKFGCWLWLLAHWIDLVLYNLCCKLYSSSIVICYLCIFASLWFVESQISSWRAPSGVAEVLQLRCLPDMEGNKASRQVGKSASRDVSREPNVSNVTHLT